MPRILVDLLQSSGTKGGIEVYARELYTALGILAPDWDFVGLCSRELSEKGAPWFPGETIDSGISGENRFDWARGELFAVSRHAKMVGADLIHCPAMLGPFRASVPVVVTVHDLLYFSHPHLMRNKLFTLPVRAMERGAIGNARRVITISHYSERAIMRHLGISPDRIDVIPLAAREAAAPRDLSPAESRRPDLFLAMGQRSPYKDFETIVRAWAALDRAERPRLVITGSHGADPLLPLVRDLGLEDSVTLKEWVSDAEMADLLDTATALIDSTLATGFSLPTLEAMARGLPVLLADTPVFREVGSTAALYFTAGDAASLAGVVRGLDETERHRLARDGLERARGFSWQTVARETLASFTAALR